MRELQAPELLEVWERGAAQTPSERALTLLLAACPDLSADELAGLSVGRRDGLLLSLREATFGPRIAGVTGCPDCGEQLELAFEAMDIRQSNAAGEKAEFSTMTNDGYELRFRLPDSRDLMLAEVATDAKSIKELLLERCLLSARCGAVEARLDQLPATTVDEMEQEMARLDAQANVQVDLTCPSCRRGWIEFFDILAFFWSELDAWAQRALVEVHKLASAYGWREQDILAMTALRRNMYLDLIGG